MTVGPLSRESVVQLIEGLVQELEGPKAAEWENQTAHDYLDALGWWLSDCAGHYRYNFDQDVPDDPWRVVIRDALLAARTYE